MRLDGLNIVVTGGMGYVGSHTCKSLLGAGANVSSIDNREVEQNKVDGVDYIHCDYADPVLLNEMRDHDTDGIVHCAGTSLVGPSVLNPTDYYTNNVVKTVQMLDHIRHWDKKPFVVFSSSAAVYGDPSHGALLTEEYPPDPCNPYGNTKMMNERILADHDKAYGIRHFCYRYFNAAGADVWGGDLGPEPGDTHIIPRIFEAYTNKKHFNLFGTDYSTFDGTCVRDYIHVCDIALAHLLACVELSNGSPSRVYNLGTSKGYSNKQIIDSFKKTVGPVKIHYDERRDGDPDMLVADATAIGRDLGWEPKFSDLQVIMESFLNYYKKHDRL